MDRGAHVVLDVVNRGHEAHDLAVHGGPSTRLLEPGGEQRLDLGKVARRLDSWCTVGSHRSLGMTLDIRLA